MKHANNRMTRIVAVLMSLLMLVSTLVIPTAAAPLLDTTDNDYGISYDDGVYTVSINAAALVELLQNKDLSKETLIDVLPEKLADFLIARDADSAVALLKDLYASVDPAQVKNDIPWDVITYNITKEDLLKVVDVDIILGLIDVALIIDSVPAEDMDKLFKPGALDAYIQNADLTDLITDDVVADVLDALTADGANLADYLADDAVDTLSGYVTLSKYINTSKALDLITGTNPVITEAEINALLTKDVINGVMAQIDVAALLNNTTVYDAFVTDAFINTVAADADFIDDVKALDFVNDMTVDELEAYLPASYDPVGDTNFPASGTTDEQVEYLIANKVDMAKLAKDNFDQIPVSMLTGFIAAEDIVANLEVVLDADDSILPAVLNDSTNGVMTKVLALLEDDISDLINDDVIDIDQIVEDVDTSVLVSCIDVDALPMDVIIDAIGTEVLVDYFMGKNPMDLVSMIDLNYLMNLPAFKNELTSLEASDILAALDKDALKNDVLAKLLNNFFYISEIALNGVSIYDGEFDLAAAEYALLMGMPTLDKLADLSANNGVVASFVLTYTVFDPEDVTAPAKEYTNGFEIALVGDHNAVAVFEEYAAKIDDIIHADFSYNAQTSAISTTLTINAPEKLAELYVSSLDNDKLPAELREKLFGIGNTVFDDAVIDDAVEAVMSKLTLDELRTLLQNVDLKNYNDKVLEKLDLYESQANAILEKLLTILDAIVAEMADNSDLKDLTLSDVYLGEGRFVLGTSVGIDITLPSALPSDITALFTNLTINNDIKLDITFEGLYRVQVLDENSNVVYTAFRTEGDDLSFLLDQDAVKALGVTEWADATNTLIDVTTLTMSAQDMTIAPYVDTPVPPTIYTAYFYIDGELYYSTTFDPANPDSLNVVAFPKVPNKHAYDFAWDWDYPQTLEARDYHIYGNYIPTVYTATFMFEGRIWALRTYTFETLPLMTMPSVPTMPYYKTAWDLSYLLLANRTYNVVKTPITYYINFVDADGNVLASDVPFNVDQFLNGTINAPAVADKEGFKWVWDYAPLQNLYDATADSLNCEISGSYVPAGESDTYTVTFYNFDGSVYKTVTFNAGETALATVPAAPKVTGYNTSWDWDFVLVNANMNVYPKKELRTYTITFKANGQVVGTDTYTIEDQSVTAPTVPAKTGYTGKWATYTLSFDGDIVVNAVYTAIEYTATFKADGKTVGTVKFTVADTKLNAPAVPAKTGYTGKWADYTIQAKDITIEATYTAVQYTATFKADGKTVGTVKFTVEDTKLNAPAVPEKAGYTGKWADYTIQAKDITIEAAYTAIEYTATFVDIKGETKVKFTVEGLTAPAVSEKEGYTGKWEAYTVEAKDMTINAVYTAIEYTITFKADGAVVGTAKYTVENKQFTAPAVPEKAGYTGSWKEVELTMGDVTIEAEYKLAEYTVTFKADGEVVATEKYTIEDKDITEPAVPEKKGYTGAWEEYELTTGDVTVNAVYTEVGGSLLWLWILIGVLVAGGIAVAAVIIIKKKKAAV